jgi:hypothetical protein
MEEESQGGAHEPMKRVFETLLKESEFTEVWYSHEPIQNIQSISYTLSSGEMRSSIESQVVACA